MEKRINELLRKMTLAEKIGQLCLVNSTVDHVSDSFRKLLAEGRIGAILNEVDINTVNELQRVAKEESRLGIPLLVGRDVIHGFKTIFPIPLGQAASWNPKLIEKAARLSAAEAARAGVNWTFAPVLDIARDPRWGRVAESFGEDPYLTSILGAAMIRGLQGNDLRQPDAVAACAKHFAGYGACESGRDYNSTNIPINELRNVHLPPFKAAIDSGVTSIMASFSDIDGIPGSANKFLLSEILRDEWRFDGFVVSDWDAIGQLTVHGIAADNRHAAQLAADAGIDMEMASTTYTDNLADLIKSGDIDEARVDEMVGNILRVKFRLGLFDNDRSESSDTNAVSLPENLKLARELATGSIVLLENKNNILPLAKETLRSVAVIGPLADDNYEQLGTWVFDGDPEVSQTPLAAMQAYLKDSTELKYARAMDSTRSNGGSVFKDAVELVRNSDVAILFLGEESILAGEAHCRADISLPGDQEQLIKQVAATDTPIVVVLMSGRPLALESIIEDIDALLFAWHPGSMTGPAIVDLLFGEKAPSGKLPVTFPRVTGQIPIYYAHKNTGRPPTEESYVHIDDIKQRAPQHSVGNTSFHLDTHYTPLYAFGHGLSYTQFEYSNISISKKKIDLGESFTISAELANVGKVEAEEIVQLYFRDLIGSVTRPVRQLVRFDRYHLKPGEKIQVSFELNSDDLAFYNRDQELVTEPGKFHAWIGGSSEADLAVEFEVVSD